MSFPLCHPWFPGSESCAPNTESSYPPSSPAPCCQIGACFLSISLTSQPVSTRTVYGENKELVLVPQPAGLIPQEKEFQCHRSLPVSTETPEDPDEEGEKPLSHCKWAAQRCLPSLLGEPLRRAGRTQSSMGAPGQNPRLGHTSSGTQGSQWDSSRTRCSLVGAVGNFDLSQESGHGLPRQPRHLAPVLTHFLGDGSSRFGLAHGSHNPSPHWYPGAGD